MGNTCVGNTCDKRYCFPVDTQHECPIDGNGTINTCLGTCATCVGNTCDKQYCFPIDTQLTCPIDNDNTINTCVGNTCDKRYCIPIGTQQTCPIEGNNTVAGNTCIDTCYTCPANDWKCVPTAICIQYPFDNIGKTEVDNTNGPTCLSCPFCNP